MSPFSGSQTPACVCLHHQALLCFSRNYSREIHEIDFNHSVYKVTVSPLTMVYNPSIVTSKQTKATQAYPKLKVHVSTRYAAKPPVMLTKQRHRDSNTVSESPSLKTNFTTDILLMNFSCFPLVFTKGKKSLLFVYTQAF